MNSNYVNSQAPRYAGTSDLGPPPPRAATAHEAASIVFPSIGEHFVAFLEQEEGGLNEIPYLNILDLNDEFWALSLGPLGTPQNPTVFVRAERQFRRYNPGSGIYEPIADSTVIGELIANLDLCAGLLPLRVKASSFIQLKNRQRLRSVVERAKDLLSVEEDVFQDRRKLHLALTNGDLLLDNEKFQPSSPNRPVRETLPVKYDPAAKCELFLGSFLAHSLEPEDIDLLQRYLSQVLEGINHSQTILVLTGDAGWGKSSLMRILGAIVGWKNVGIVREQLFKDEYELAHYTGKHFLFHPDMPTQFLDRPEASIFKQLVGGDPLWANTKAGDGRTVLHGTFPIILACNGKPKIHLDQDADAWLRRLLVLSFKTPTHEQHIGKMAELILKTEASGILNWLLQGRTKLFKDKLQLPQTPQQKGRTTTLVLGSESPQAFVRGCLIKQKDADLGVVDLYTHYQEWCRKSHVRPFASQAFTQRVKEEIEISLGLKYRHDLESSTGKTKRGWKGLNVVEQFASTSPKQGPLGPN